MALAKQKISIPLIQGIETKLDDKQEQIGNIEVLENVVFDTPGKLKKRKGYDKLDVTLTDDSKITDTQRITTYKDELCLFNKTNFYSYSESTKKWTEKGRASNIFPTSTPIVRNTYQQTNVDSVNVSGIEAYAWEDTRGGIRITVLDTITGNALLSDSEITATGTTVRVEYIGNNIFFLYVDGTDIKYRKLNPNNPSNITAEASIVSADLNATNKLYDTASVDSRIFITYNSAAATLKTFSFDEAITLSSVSTDSETASGALCLNYDDNSKILISYYNGTEIKALVKSYNLTANIVAPTVIETIANVVNTTIGSNDETNYSVLYEISAAQTYNHFIRKNTINTSATVGTAADFIRSCGLASKQFSYESDTYVAVIHESSLQSTMFFVNDDAKVIAKISEGLSGTLISQKILTKVSPVSSSSFLVASQIKGRTVSEDNTLFSLLGINKTVLDFNSDTRFDTARISQQLHTNGGVIQSYDGKEIVEHGFHIFPENITNASTASTGGSISDGQYQYSAVYTWTDNRGQQHKSAPSIPLSVTLSAGTSTQTQTITVPTLRITEKSNVVIDLYRTEATGTIFYKVTSVSAANYNDKTADSVNLVDTLSDTSLISNELLYTTSGELENIAPPAASIIEVLNNRVFLAGLENENTIQYSKINSEGTPLEFNDTLTLQVDSRGGPIIALAAMDDKLIIFKETAIYYLTGDGPNNLGEQNNFIEPELLSSDLGCETQNSIVLTPQGLMFKSKKGIYLLNRAMQTSYVGSSVEDYNNLSIKAANLIPTKNIAIFITDGDALVFDYFVQKWTTYTNHKGISATVLNESYYYVRPNNEVYKQSETSHTDAGSFVKLKLETAWLSFAGIQGYQRVYRMLLLGDYKSPHKLHFKIAYNFVDAFIQEKTIDTADFTSDTTYGTDSPYGTGTPYGGSGNQYQVRLDMKTQKCQSIKISIEDSQDDNYGEGLQISNLSFIIGAKQGEYKPSQSRIYGAS